MEVTLIYHWYFLKIHIKSSLYIADWQLFCGPILRLINEKSLLLNMKNLASIIVAFAEQHFTTGAIFVAKEILSVSKNLVRCLSEKDIDAYIDAIIALQSSSTLFPKESNSMEMFASPIISLLTPRQQCRLLIDLQANNYSRLKDLPTCHQFYKKLCKTQFHYGYWSSSSELEIIDGMIDCFIRLEDEILELLVICLSNF